MSILQMSLLWHKRAASSVAVALTLGTCVTAGAQTVKPQAAATPARAPVPPGTTAPETPLPGTTVTARTSSSGEFSASIRAMASSEPGSVSMIIFLVALDAGIANVTTKNAARIAAMKNFWRTRKPWSGVIRTDLQIAEYRI